MVGSLSERPGGSVAARVVIDRSGLDELLAALLEDGFTVVGPTVRDGAIVLAPLGSAAELPAGWSDEQRAAGYRLVRSGGEAVFCHNAGPGSWKDHLFPSRLRLWRARRTEGGGMEVEQPPQLDPRLALVGVRACDLQAIAVQDRVLLGGEHIDDDYAARRRAVFVVAVSCAKAGATCFCASMGIGPHPTGGFDLALTELLDGGGHRFLVEVGSQPGAALLARVPHRAPSAADDDAAARCWRGTAAELGRSLDTDGIKELLYRNREHPRWEEVAERCLSCGNCTLVCPTCFCTTVEDHTDLAGEEAKRVRVWDSCFGLEHSYMT